MRNFFRSNLFNFSVKPNVKVVRTGGKNDTSPLDTNHGNSGCLRKILDTVYITTYVYNVCDTKKAARFKGRWFDIELCERKRMTTFTSFHVTFCSERFKRIAKGSMKSLKPLQA